jgi:hypothetical protein
LSEIGSVLKISVEAARKQVERFARLALLLR